MGLDVTAYCSLQPVECTDINCDHVHIWINPDFPARASDIKMGCYTPGRRYHFRAGSYGGYNWWRDELSRMANGKPASSLWSIDRVSDPFYELIHFSDCEGTLGPSVCQNLAEDFTRFMPNAEFYSREMQGGDYWFELYKKWNKAIHLGSMGGAVCFH